MMDIHFLTISEYNTVNPFLSGKSYELLDPAAVTIL